jgi:hypothetical protein
MESALHCILDAIPEPERNAHVRLAGELFGRRAQERRDLPDGYAFRFEPDALEALARFVANERHCCPFLAFTISAAGQSHVWLEIAGPTGTREFLAAELPRIQST